MYPPRGYLWEDKNGKLQKGHSIENQYRGMVVISIGSANGLTLVKHPKFDDLNEWVVITEDSKLEKLKLLTLIHDL